MFKVVWHSEGCIVFAVDGIRMVFSGHKYSFTEINSLGTKAKIAKLPGAKWKRFSR